ncbi:calcium-activated potassium channel subunit beta-3 isoform X1 [Sphaeramia orbicularis]|uniref:calcium-activated potassium channel subunit beta-3 isoform X1 n=1 Tax=Sphaeramia orbicularis TaxID=375764 RepID=UPI00117DA80C|nr:calcium-activated potassium channel subunit beta-3-like isoform X1 [Sphaeramia orbicularis]
MRNRRTHVFGELLASAAVQEQEGARGLNVHGGQRSRAQMPVSSVGEDRAILLGFTMMAFAVLMFFVVGITTVKPYVNSNWEEEASCVLLQTTILDQWVDCRGVSAVPCLRVTVNLSGSHQLALLHFDEESVLLAPECFYIPKCRMDRPELEGEVQKLKSSLDARVGRVSSCLTDRARHPQDAILNRKYTMRTAMLALLWPSLMLGGGALLVGLVKMTQCLAHLSSEMCSETSAGRLTSKYTQGRLYKLLRRASVQSPT